MIGELSSGDPEMVGPFRLGGRLGAGGMGRVFLGQSAGGRLVAVKVIRPELAGEPGFRRRFAREVAAARNVSGLFTALVVDADPDAAVPWLATAYVAGPSLAEAVEEHGPFPAASVAALAAGLAEGLEAIHGAGVVHRDLKPANVLLAQDGPRVIDFGISRAVETTMLTQTGIVMGSPGFLSPEQADGADVGAPSDIFSLGAVLTFAANGEGPFGSGPTPALMYRVVNREPDLGRVPAMLRALIERCLAKDPASRPTPAELLAELGGGLLAADWLPEPVAVSLDQYAARTQDVAAAARAARIGRIGAGQTTAADVPGRPAAGPGRPAAGAPGRRRRWWPAAAVAAALILAAGAAAFALNGAGNGHQSAGSPAIQAAKHVRASTRAPAGSATASALASVKPAATRMLVKHAAARHTAPARATHPASAAAAGETQPSATKATAAPPAKPAPGSPKPTKPAQAGSATVPGVVGETLSAAGAALNAAGFENVPWVNGCYGSDNFGDVVTESPGAGTRLALTSPVHLYLQADNCVTMPDVAGFSLASAESTLEAVGFAPADITWRDACYGAYPVNEVVTQSPPAGTSDGKTQLVALGVEANNCG
jgi:eukaryotic-like serine/threonine-protein kinase